MGTKRLSACTGLILFLFETIHIGGGAGHRREIRGRERITLPEPRDRAAHRVLHQRRESVSGEVDQRGRAPYQLGRRSGRGPASETQHSAQHGEEAAGAPYDDPRELFRVLTQRRVRLAQPDQLAHQLVLELASHMAAVHLDAGPWVAPREQPVRITHVLVLDREGVRRLPPLPLGEDEGRGLACAGPVAHRRSKRREQGIVHRVADEQRIHVGSVRYVRPARPRSVEQQRHQTLAERAGDLACEPLDWYGLGHGQKRPPAPPPENPPPPPNPPKPPPPPPPPHPPLEPLQPPRPWPNPPSQNGSRKKRPRLRTINRTRAMMSHLTGNWGTPRSSGSGGGTPDSVTPNSCAKACAIRSTPYASPAP